MHIHINNIVLKQFREEQPAGRICRTALPQVFCPSETHNHTHFRVNTHGFHLNSLFVSKTPVHGPKGANSLLASFCTLYTVLCIYYSTQSHITRCNRDPFIRYVILWWWHHKVWIIETQSLERVWNLELWQSGWPSLTWMGRTVLWILFLWTGRSPANKLETGNPTPPRSRCSGCWPLSVHPLLQSAPLAVGGHTHTHKLRMYS